MHPNPTNVQCNTWNKQPWVLVCVKKKRFLLTILSSFWCYCIVGFFFLFILQFGKILLLKGKQNIRLAFLPIPSPWGCLETPQCKVPLKVKHLWPGKKCTNISGCSLDVASPVYWCATLDHVPWVGMWWQSHLEEVSSARLWQGAVISGTSGWVCKVYPTTVLLKRNSYRQWRERGLGFCLRE